MCNNPLRKMCECMSNVRQCEEVCGCKKPTDEVRFEDIELKCIGVFAYLGNMFNDTGRAEQAMATRVRTACMKFREQSGLLCTRGAC